MCILVIVELFILYFELVIDLLLFIGWKNLENYILYLFVLLIVVYRVV